MYLSYPIRTTSAALVLLALIPSSLQAQTHRQSGTSANPAPQTRVEKLPRQHAGNTRNEHLKDWISQHSNLTPTQQQEALEKEPGFRDLPPQTQQRMRDQLAKLNSMPPARRERLLERNEWMEHLSVDQRIQVRQATQQLAKLPPDERRYVYRTFRGLRELPPAQRDIVLKSDRFSHLTSEQRATLDGLMKVEPLLPPAYDGGQPVQQQPTQ